MTTDTFTITPPSQEDVDTHASLEPYKVTPSAQYRGTLGEAGLHEKCSDTWVAVSIPVTLISDVDGQEAVKEIAIAGRGEAVSVSTELFQRTREDDTWIGVIGNDGEILRRTDDNAQIAYGISYKLVVQLFQALGALPVGDTDLGTLGFVTDIGLLNADAIIEALSGYDGAEIGVQIRNQVQKRKGADGKKTVVRDAENRPRREAVITDFFTL